MLDLLVAAWVGLASLVAFLLMVHDKRRARSRGRRISERTLLAWVLAGGAPGAHLAMITVRHKTRHLRFRLLVPIFAIGWIIVVVVLFVR